MQAKRRVGNGQPFTESVNVSSFHISQAEYNYM